MVIYDTIAGTAAINRRKNGKRFFLSSLIHLFIVVFAFPGILSPGQAVQGQAETTIKPNLSSLKYGKLPLYFIPNQGQVHEKALFYAGTHDYTLWITKEGLVFDSLKREDGEN